MEVSKFNLYSLGIVAENKELNTRVVEVFAIEDNQMFDGEIHSDSEEYKAEGIDPDGVEYKQLVETKVTVKATWLPFGSTQRITAPDVRRGERVMLFRLGDTDKFYWTSYDDLYLRKLETVIFAFSDTRDESKGVDPEHYWFFEVSTHKKHIHLHTTKSDGELWKYDIQINSADGNGFVKIQDDDDNFIILDSKERQIIAQNKDRSKVDIDKRNIFIEAADLIRCKTNTLIMESVNNITRATNITEQASSISETAGTRSIQAQTCHVGNHSVVGSMGSTGGYTGGGIQGGVGRFTPPNPTVRGLSYSGSNNTDNDEVSAPTIPSPDVVPDRNFRAFGSSGQYPSSPNYSVHSFIGDKGGNASGGITRSSGLSGLGGVPRTTGYFDYKVNFMTPGAMPSDEAVSGIDPIIDIDVESRTIRMLAKEAYWEIQNHRQLHNTQKEDTDEMHHLTRITKHEGDTEFTDNVTIDKNLLVKGKLDVLNTVHFHNDFIVDKKSLFHDEVDVQAMLTANDFIYRSTNGRISQFVTDTATTMDMLNERTGILNDEISDLKNRILALENKP